MKTYAVLFALAFLTSYVGTPLLRRLATHWGLLDSAIAAGPQQRRPIPRIGGVIIYVALLGSLFALSFPNNVIREEFRAQLPILWLLWGPATLLLLVGVADDIWGMNAWVKFLAQVGAALWLVSAGVRISHLSLPWGHTAELGFLSTTVTLLWLVGVTNAFNLIDGLDGLAAGVAFLSATAIAVTAMMVNDRMVVVITVALAGALLGFLRHNFNPATILLGDSGSMFIGFVLAASAVVWYQKATTAIAVAAPLLAFALPVADTTLTVLRRALRGQPLFESDRHHIHHRLLSLGWTPRQVVLLLYATSALAALGCILIARGHNIVTGMVLLLFMGVCWFGVRRLAYPEFTEIGRAFSRKRVAAQARLQERREVLQAAASAAEFWERLKVSADLLELDYLELRVPAERRGRLQLPAEGPLRHAAVGPADQGAPLWLLSVPLPSGSALILGRDPLRTVSGLPMEVVAKELSAVVEETLFRLDSRPSVAAAAAAPAAELRRWAPTAKTQV